MSTERGINRRRRQHAGPVLNPATTAAFAAGGGDEMPAIMAEERLHSGSSGVYVYDRYWNPTRAHVEQHIAELEHPGGAKAVLVASGMAAIVVALGTLTESRADIRKRGPGAQRRKVLYPNQLYGGTLVWLQDDYVNVWYGETVCVDIDKGDPSEVLVEAILREQPGIIFVEIVTNPTLRTLDIKRIVGAAKQVDAMVIVDNTIPTCKLVRPLQLGADVVLHSATKSLGGHGNVTAGVIIVRDGSILPERCDRRGTDGTLDAALRNYLKFSGSILGVREAFELHSQLRTFHVRMEAQLKNAAALADYLNDHPKVERVYYPGLADDPCHPVARELFENRGYGSLVTIELREVGSATRLIDALDKVGVAYRLTLGDLDTEVLHITDVFGAGRFPGQSEMVRISVGCEDTDDLLRRFDQALLPV